MEKIDTVVQRYIEQDGPGLIVHITARGQVIYSQNYGFADLERRRTLTPNSILCFASLTKQFTAAAVLLLERQKKLCIADTVAIYLPDFPHSTITLAHLLTHTSGLENLSWETFLARARDTHTHWRQLSQEARWQARYSILRALAQETEPGSHFLYNNYGYQLLGLIIEAVSGLNYEAFLHTAIFEPLGMQSACLVTEVDQCVELATGYTYDDGWRCVPFAPQSSLAYSSGGLCGSLEDLLRWEHCLRTYQLLEQESWQRMYTPFILNDGRTASYGFGWFIAGQGEPRRAYHGGLMAGFAHLFTRFLDIDTSVLLLSNNSSLRPRLGEFTRALVALHILG